MSGITLLSLWAGRELTSKQGVPKDSFSYYPPKYLRINTHTQCAVQHICNVCRHRAHFKVFAYTYILMLHTFSVRLPQNGLHTIHLATSPVTFSFLVFFLFLVAWVDECPEPIRHFLIESSAKGVRVNGSSQEPYFGECFPLDLSDPISNIDQNLVLH